MTDYELPNEVYLSEKLRSFDREPLVEFVDMLSSGLANKSLDSAILAVGSSTFPDKYWKKLDQLNKKWNFSFNLAYNDIDLRIVPEKIVPVTSLMNKVRDVLLQNNCVLSTDYATLLGAWPLGGFIDFNSGIFKKTMGSSLSGLYGSHAISTYLKNGRKLDLILDFDVNVKTRQNVFLTAEQKILKERSENMAFSVLYLPASLKE